MLFSRARAALVAPLDASPRARGRAESLVQAAVLVSVTLLALGLPLAWNRAVAIKVDFARAEHAVTSAARAARAADAREAMLAEVLVNERRAARGLAPYDFAAPRDALA
jgi:hypothetical protein